MARNGDSIEQMKAALASHQSAESNKKALIYAPWVLSLMLILVVREKATTFDIADWGMVGAFVVALPMLGRSARNALHKQQQRAEATIERLVKEGRGIDDLNRLQTESSRYRNVRLSSSLQITIVDAARAREVRDQERRQRMLKDEATGPGVSPRVPALSGR